MRYASLDILRTLAICVMVVVHFEENLSGKLSPIAGLGAPLFAFLSGMSYRLWVNGQESRGRSAEEISKVSIRRGLFVFGVGFAFNILVWMPADTFNWDVLTFIGAALVVLNVARRMPLSVVVFAAMVCLLLSPVLRALSDYHSYWLNAYYEGDLTLIDVLRGFLSTGYFPVFPWLTYSLAGLVTASLLFRTDGEPPPPIRHVALLGCALMLCSFLAIRLRPWLPEWASRHLLQGWTMYPPTLEYVSGTLGMALLLFSALHAAIDRRTPWKLLAGPLNVAQSMSGYAFTIYVAHHLVHLWPLWIVALAEGEEPTYYWREAMSTAWSLPLALLFLVGCLATMSILGPRRSYGIESCMRWLCDEP